MNKLTRTLLYGAALLAISTHINRISADSRVPVLTLPDISQWEENSFDGHTSYELVNLDGQHALKASSQASASGYMRKIDIDLNQTPYLNWHWRIDNLLQNIDEQTKKGDDYPARIYVVISGGLFIWKTRALNYVWSSNQPVNSVWPNAFTDKAILIAHRSGQAQVGQWVKEKRNILADIKKYLKTDAVEINAVAIMTDTDNSGQSATAYYGDIYFSSE